MLHTQKQIFYNFMSIRDFKFSKNLMKKVFLPFFSICLTVCVLQANAQQTASEFFDIGVNKSKAGDYIGASQAYSTAIAMNPENSTSYYNRGLAKQQLKDHRGAILDFDRTIDLDSKNALAYKAEVLPISPRFASAMVKHSLGI